MDNAVSVMALLLMMDDAAPVKDTMTSIYRDKHKIDQIILHWAWFRGKELMQLGITVHSKSIDDGNVRFDIDIAKKTMAKDHGNNNG